MLSAVTFAGAPARGVAAPLACLDLESAHNAMATVVSPFDVAPRDTVGVSALPAAPAQDEEASPADMSGVQRIVLAGLSGLAMLGALGLGGCAHPSPTPTSQSQSLDLHTSGGARVTHVDGGTLGLEKPRSTPAQGVPGQQTPSAPAQQTPVQGQPPRRIRVLGQDLGTTNDGVQNVEWSTYTGTFKGQTIEIEYPKGWRVTKMGWGLAVINPQKPEEFVAFQWRDSFGGGPISPQQLLSAVLQEAEANGVRVNAEKALPPRQTPSGTMLQVQSDLSYTVDGQAVRGQFLTGVTNAPGGGPYWVGFVSGAQASQQDFQKDLPVLLHVSNSLSLK